MSERRSCQLEFHFKDVLLQLPKPMWLVAANPNLFCHLLYVVEAVLKSELVRLLLSNAALSACLRKHFDLQAVVLRMRCVTHCLGGLTSSLNALSCLSSLLTSDWLIKRPSSKNGMRIVGKLT